MSEIQTLLDGLVEGRAKIEEARQLVIMYAQQAHVPPTQLYWLKEPFEAIDSAIINIIVSTRAPEKESAK